MKYSRMEEDKIYVNVGDEVFVADGDREYVFTLVSDERKSELRFEYVRTESKIKPE